MWRTSRGFDIFTCDNTASGESGGKLFGYNVFESADCLKWLNFLRSQFGEDIKVVLHGFSLGGATVLKMSDRCPDCVKFIVSDSGFIDAREILRSQLGPLYGLMAEFVYTSLGDTPEFVNGDVQLIYMGAMTESAQERAIAWLMPYRERIAQLVSGGTVFLMTANAGEVFCDHIENEDGSRIEGLKIFDLYAKRDMMHRHNSTVLCEFESMKLVGFKAEFSQLYGDNSANALATVSYGTGINSKSKLEGVRINNFFSTAIVGPFLLMNPGFVKYLMKLLGIENPELKYEPVIMAAYERRLADIERMSNK